MMKKVAVAALLCATAGMASASSEGWYVTGGMGLSHHDIDMSVEGADSSSDSKNQFGLKIGGGYKFNQNLAVEGNFFYLGKAEGDASAGSGYNKETLNASSESLGFGADVLGILPVTENFDVFAKAGLAVMSTKQKATLEDHRAIYWVDSTETRLVPKLGLGAEFSLTDHWAVRADYDHFFKTSDDSDWQVESNHDLLTVGVKYTF